MFWARFAAAAESQIYAREGVDLDLDYGRLGAQDLPGPERRGHAKRAKGGHPCFDTPLK